MFFDKIRHEITLKAAFLTFTITLLATIVRPILINQSILFTYIGAANSLLMGCVYLYFKYSTPKHWHPMLFTCLGLLVLSPITFVSGGVNSQFAFLFPTVPIFIALIGNARYTWATAVLLLAVVVSMYIVSGFFPDFTYENVPDNKSAARAVWLCLAILLSTIFCVQLSRIYGTLGNKISEQATTDQLTGLSNRHAVMEFLKTEVAVAKVEECSLSMMMIDIDHFKLINDTYGHLIGDKCLKKLSDVIKQNVRNSSDLTGRFGGEEFIVVIKNIDSQKAKYIANNIRIAIEQSTIAINESQHFNVTATIGVYTFRGDNSVSIEQIINSADQALYQGKNEGRNRVVVAIS